MIEVFTSIIFLVAGVIILIWVIKKNILDKELLYPWTLTGLPNPNTKPWRIIESIIFGGMGIISLIISLMIIFDKLI